MDTRSKIISYEQALELAAQQPVRWVIGHFDPLLAEHVQRLNECTQPGHPLIVVVADPASSEPLMPQRSRAELVAALAGVDYVVMRAGPLDDPEESAITRGFIDHVLRRNGRELS